MIEQILNEAQIVKENLTNPDFLDGVNLTDKEKDRVKEALASKPLRIALFAQTQRIFQLNPKTIEEAAAKFWEAKGLMNLIPVINIKGQD